LVSGESGHQFHQIISEHRRHPELRGFLLDMLLGARDEETGEGMTDRQVRDEVLTLTSIDSWFTPSLSAVGSVSSAPRVK
jgi:hypothetical protein